VAGGGNEVQAVEAEAFADFDRQPEVAVVDRIEAAAVEPEAHLVSRPSIDGE